MAEDNSLPKISYNKRASTQAYSLYTPAGSANDGQTSYSQAATGNAHYSNFTAAGKGAVYSRYGFSGQSSHSNISPSLEQYTRPSQLPRQNSYSRYLPASNNSSSYIPSRWSQQEPTTPTSVKQVQFIINTANAHLYHKFITDPSTGIPHQERIVNGELQRVLVGTDILDWIMTNLDGASLVEQARVVGCQLLLCDLIEDVTNKDNKNFNSGPNSFYCVCDMHKEKPTPMDAPPEEKTDESDKNKKRSLACVIF